MLTLRHMSAPPPVSAGCISEIWLWLIQHDNLDFETQILWAPEDEQYHPTGTIPAFLKPAAITALASKNIEQSQGPQDTGSPRFSVQSCLKLLLRHLTQAHRVQGHRDRRPPILTGLSAYSSYGITIGPCLAATMRNKHSTPGNEAGFPQISSLSYQHGLLSTQICFCESIHKVTGRSLQRPARLT